MTLVYVPFYFSPEPGETVVQLVGRYREAFKLTEAEAFNIVGQQAKLVTSDVITPDTAMTQAEFDQALGDWAPGGLGDGYQALIKRIGG